MELRNFSDFKSVILFFALFYIVLSIKALFSCLVVVLTGKTTGDEGRKVRIESDTRYIEEREIG